MSSIDPWVSVEPSTIPAAILGPLPFVPGSVTYAIPADVVPSSANGILVFAWYAITGAINQNGWWHFTVNVAGGAQNWFSLMVAAGLASQIASPCNSQAFWLPMPVDGNLEVTLFNGQLPPAGQCEGYVEIHGYYP
ncbi:MAG TPA: hypothetical protein VMU84_21050 [Thermoanaerobaculia bacterium]|nr:hypothetical protein [Thermoanaerobaculia bacterium]